MAKSRPSGATSRVLYLHENVSEPQKTMRLSPDEYSRMVALRREIKEYTKRFTGENSYVINRSSGAKIRMTRKGIKESTNGPRQLEELEALRHLPGMLRRAKYEGSQPNLKPNDKPDVVQYHKYSSTRKIFGKIYHFVIKVEEQKNGNFFYDSYTKKDRFN